MLPSRALPFGGNFDFDGMEEIQQPFASATFANLLVQLAPTLRILELAASGGSATVSNDLQAEPHSGSLDYAIGQCRLLERIYMPWAVTSTTLLTCLANSPGLTEATFVGNAVNTSAKDISECLSWPKYKPSLTKLPSQ
jgi:hypothetical protein